MINSGEIANRLQAILIEKNWKPYKLSRESGLAYTSVLNILKGKYEPSFTTLSKICDCMEVSLTDFFAGIETPGVSNQDKFNEAFGKLTIREKELVLAYIQGLLAK